MAGRHRKAAARGRHRRPTSHGRYLATGVVAVAVLGLGGVGAHAALSGGSGGSPPPAAQVTPAPTPSSDAAVTPTPTPVRTPAPASKPPVAAPNHPAAALTLTITGQVSWVEVTRPDGRVLVSGLVRHGRRLTYRHGPLRVTIGDAGAVRLVRHGHVHAPAGRPGQVLRFTL